MSKPPTPEVTSSLLRRLREDCDLTMTQMADLFAADEDTYTEWEAGSKRVPVKVWTSAKQLSRFPSPQEVAAIRTQLGLSIQSLSAYLGVGPEKMEAWESGREIPSARQAFNIQGLTVVGCPRVDDWSSDRTLVTPVCREHKKWRHSAPSPPVTPNLILATRAAFGWTQEMMAYYCGVNRVTLARWETGERHPRNRGRKRLLELIQKSRDQQSQQEMKELHMAANDSSVPPTADTSAPPTTPNSALSRLTRLQDMGLSQHHMGLLMGTHQARISRLMREIVQVTLAEEEILHYHLDKLAGRGATEATVYTHGWAVKIDAEVFSAGQVQALAALRGGTADQLARDLLNGRVAAAPASLQVARLEEALNGRRSSTVSKQARCLWLIALEEGKTPPAPDATTPSDPEPVAPASPEPLNNPAWVQGEKDATDEQRKAKDHLERYGELRHAVSGDDLNSVAEELAVLIAQEFARASGYPWRKKGKISVVEVRKWMTRPHRCPQRISLKLLDPIETVLSSKLASLVEHMLALYGKTDQEAAAILNILPSSFRRKINPGERHFTIAECEALHAAFKKVVPAPVPAPAPEPTPAAEPEPSPIPAAPAAPAAPASPLLPPVSVRRTTFIVSEQLSKLMDKWRALRAEAQGFEQRIADARQAIKEAVGRDAPGSELTSLGAALSAVEERQGACLEEKRNVEAKLETYRPRFEETLPVYDYFVRDGG